MIEGIKRTLAVLVAALLLGCPNQNEGGIIGNGVSAKDRPTAINPGIIIAEENESTEIVLAGKPGAQATGPLLYVIVTRLPRHGMVLPFEGFAPLTVSYTPDEDYTGNDDFDFLVIDSSSTTSFELTVHIEVFEAGSFGESAATAKDAPVALTLGAGAAGSRYYVQVLQDSSAGAIDVESGFFPLDVTYTPPPGFTGAEGFQYLVTDLESANTTLESATVTVTP